MPAPASSTELVQFGVFELDLRRAELRKQGVRVKLQEQPLKVLQVLLENPGQMVSREDLRQQVWPANTFVEFDQGLYSAMARLRDALGDSSESPRFIETVARRGYRFIAPVIKTPPAPASAPSPPGGLPETAGTGVSRRWIASLLGGLIGGALLLAIAFGFDVAGAREWLRSRAVPIRSIAVLPLENLSGDPEQEYFADGMTDELITTLARLGNVRVVSRTSVMRFKKTTKPLGQVAQELSVDAVVEGTVERSGNRVRIRVQLIQAASDRHLWAQTYDRELRDTLLLQSEAARDIAEEIESKLTVAQQQRLAAARPVDPQAHEAYLKGLYFSNKRTRPDFEHAIGYFEEAIAKDPQYAAAYYGLSDALLGELWTGVSGRNIRDRATWAARKAIEMGPSSSEAHLAVAGIHEFFDWDWQGADQEYRRALDINPNLAAGRQEYAVFLAFQGRFDEAIAQAQQAQDLDPLSPFIRATFCLNLYYARQYQRALEKCRQALELDPNFHHAHGNLVGVYVHMGQYDRAWEEYEKLAGAAGKSQRQLAAIRQAFQRDGMKGLWREELKFRGADEDDQIDAAGFYSLLGESEHAFAALQKGYQQRSPFMEDVKSDPDFDNLRSDPRYAALLRRVGLQP